MPALSTLVLIAAMILFAWRAYDMMVSSYYALADEHGYLTTAKRLATTGTFAQHQPDPYAFIGETMMQSPRDPAVYYLRQPIGYPVLCAAAYFAWGPDGPFMVNPLLGLALLGGIYVVGKELGSRLLGALAALVIAAHPLVLYYTVMALSHIPDMAAATWAIAFALLWRRERRMWQACALGAFLGLSILIRYTNVLLLLPLLVILTQEVRSERRRGAWRAAIIAAVCAGVMLIPLAIYQWRAFGSPWRTGYSAGGNGTSFSWTWFLAHAPAMGSILLHPGTGLGVLLAGMAIGVVVLAWKDRWTLALLLAWALPPLAAYTAYYGMPERNTVLYARFALSSFVPLVLLGMIWAARLPKHRRTATAAAGVLALAAAVWSAFNPFMAQQLADLNNEMLFTFSTRNLVLKDIPAGSIVLADDFTHYFLDYAGDYTLYDPDMFREAPLARRLADLNHVPHEFDPARTRQLAGLLGGKSDAQLAALLRARIEHYQQAGKPVYLVTMMVAEDHWAHTIGLPLKLVDNGGLMMGVYEFEEPQAGTRRAP